MKKRSYIILFILVFMTPILWISMKIWFSPFFHQKALSSLKQIQQNKNITFQWKNFQDKPWWLKVELHSVEFQHQLIDQNFQSQKIVFQINLWASLIKRQIVINMRISDLNYTIQIEKDTQTYLKDIFHYIQKLPIHQLVIERLRWKAHSPGGDLLSPQTQLSVTNHSDNLQIKFDSDIELQEYALNLRAHLLIKESKMDFISLQFSDEKSSALIDGEWNNWPLLQGISLNINTKWNIQKALPWLLLFKDIPFSAEGFWNIQAQFNYYKEKKWKANFDIEASDVVFKNIFLTQVKSKGKITHDDIQWELIHLEKKNGWTSSIENAKLEWNADQPFQFNHFSHIKNFKDIESIFNWNTAFQFRAPLNGKCQGELKNLKIQCSIDAKFNDLSILQKDTSNIQFHSLNFKGNWSWNPTKKFWVKGIFKAYQSQIEIQGSFIDNHRWQAAFYGKFDSSNFQNFFNQKFHSKMDFKKGILQWDDNKKDLYIKSQIQLKDLKWAHIDLGDMTAQLYIKPNQINLKKIKIQKGQSDYTGDISFLTEKSWVKAQIQSNRLFLENISESLVNILSLPLPIIGKGYLKLLVNSPLDIKQLNYELNSQFRSIKIQDDFFKSLTLNINSQKGKATITKGILIKNKGLISLIGNFNTSSNNLDLKIKGQDLLLEKSESIQQNWDSLSGILKFQSSISGTFKEPKGRIQFQLDPLTHQFVHLGKTQGQFEFKSQQFKGNASLFDQKVRIEDIRFSIFDKSTPVSFKANFKKWNFIALWPTRIVSDQIYSNATGSASFYFPWDQPQSLTGYLDLKKLYIQYGLHSLKMISPSYLNFNKGEFSLRNSNSKWMSQDSKISFNRLSDNKTQIKGLMRLEFLNIFLPYIKNISGDIDLNITLNNNLKNWNPIGSFKIFNGTLHISPYVDILQSLELNALIKDRQLNIEKMIAKTPYEGEVEGLGMIGFFDQNNFPIDLNFKLKRSFGIYINKSIQGFGHGNLRIHGDKKPYLMSGDFFVQSGYFKQELQHSENQISNPIEQSEEKEVFHWDMNLVFQQPFPLENTLFTAFVKGSLRMKGRFNNPNTLGEIRFIPKGILHLREYDFQLESGWLNYKSQPLLDPIFQFVGNTHFEEMKLDDNQKEITTLYKITANVSGKADDFDFKLNSQPSLPEEDILSMMALGARSIGFSNPSQQMNQIASYSGYRIGSMLFQDTIGKELNKLLGVQIYITPYINIQKNAPSSKIELHKRWFKKLHTSYTQSIDEDYNSFKLEYSLAPDFSILGIWENDKEEGSPEDSSLGLELEYKLDF